MENKTGTFSMAETPSLLVTLLALTFVTINMLKFVGLLKGRRPRLPPGPTALPFIGCLIQVLRNKPTFRWIHRVMEEMNTEIACFRIGSVHVIPVTSPELAREFLKRQDRTFSSRPECMSANMTSKCLGAILAPYGDHWKKMRRVLATEVLSQEKHLFFHDKRVQEADHLVLYVYNRCRNPEVRGVVNVRLAARQYCGNLSRSLVFSNRFFGKGMEDGGPGAEEVEHLEGYFTILQHIYGFGIADYIPCLEAFDFDGYKGILQKAMESVTKYQNPLIEERMQQWKDGIKTRKEDILDILISLKDSNGNSILTMEDIKAQIIEIMVATLDNPSNNAEWALAEMLNQPDIFSKALEELDSVVGTERLVQESDLPKLNYIKACARESFRLHPVTSFNPPHVAMENAMVGGYSIPKGSRVILSRPGLGRNPRIWRDPLLYNPERHLLDIESSDQVILADQQLNMLSFSIGRRGCPGVLLGSTMAVVLLARMVHSFTWTKLPGATNVNLAECENDLSMAETLHAVATPRLSANVYLELQN